MSWGTSFFPTALAEYLLGGTEELLELAVLHPIISPFFEADSGSGGSGIMLDGDEASGEDPTLLQSPHVARLDPSPRTREQASDCHPFQRQRFLRRPGELPDVGEYKHHEDVIDHAGVEESLLGVLPGQCTAFEFAEALFPHTPLASGPKNKAQVGAPRCKGHVSSLGGDASE